MGNIIMAGIMMELYEIVFYISLILIFRFIYLIQVLLRERLKNDSNETLKLSKFEIYLHIIATGIILAFLI